jgi:hypothetical protein
MPRKVYFAARKALENNPITKDEILDKSKGDALFKGITVLQTTWFLVQLFTRLGKRLNVTEFEVVTLAYAALNAGSSSIPLLVR